MLVLARRKDQDIVINHDIIVKVVKMRGDTVWLGFDAPSDVTVHRGEIESQIRRGKINDGNTDDGGGRHNDSG